MSTVHIQVVQRLTIVCVDIKKHLTLLGVILAWWLCYKEKVYLDMHTETVE